MNKMAVEGEILRLETQIQTEYQNLGKAILERTRECNVRVDALADEVIRLKQLLMARQGDDRAPR